MDLELTPTKSDDDAEIDTPPHTYHTYNPSSFTTAVVKNRHHQPPLVAAYKECMKNHAAGLGGHAVDGCCEYMPHTSTSAAPTDSTLLKCAACGCHRNFHRRQPDSTAAAVIAPPFLDFRLPAQLPKRTSPSTCTSPPPVSELPCGHTLLALSTAVVVASEEHHQEPLTPTGDNNPGGGRKRSRTKFSREQKEKMHSFSEKIGWKMYKSDEAAAEEFCRENGVAKSVLRVWMHNHKNAFGKKESTITTSGTGGVIINGKLITSSDQNNNGGNSSSENEEIGNTNIDKWQSFSE